MKNIFLNSALVSFISASCFYALYLLVGRKKRWGDIASGLLLFGLLFISAAIIERWRTAGRAPLSNLYESVVFFVWSLAAVYLIIELVYKNKLLGWFISILLLFGLAYVSFLDPSIEPLVPALQSNWLTAHVVTCFLGYAGFAVSFAASLAYLFVRQDKVFDALSYKSVAFGFPFLAAGIIAGAVWANQAWGTYWSWDPKETWSLITWFVYAAYLHARFTRGWTGKRAAWFSVAGFASVIFTYLGVSFLLSGLHSYM